MSTSFQTSEPQRTKGYYTPEWAKHIIWYQLFPERFYNGDPSNDPTPERVAGENKLPENWKISPWTGDWYERADWEKELGPKFRDGVFYRRYGGDLQGIIDKLDYLTDLGIGAIYLNPVFDAVSLHKYDTSVYHHIDRFFGPDPEGDGAIMEQEDPSDPSTWQWTSADKLFLRLVEEVHKRDMKIIIDGVFNHSGRDFWAFRDLIKNQQQSDFKDWYDVISFDDPATPDVSEFDYHGWWGVKDLPEFRGEDSTLVKPIREHIFAITRRWMDPDGDGDPADGIDGWRLDVPEEVGINFWKEWCAVVREVNPEAYISGEVWTDNAVTYLKEGLFSAVMNYRFAETVQDYMIDRGLSAHDFAKILREIRERYPEESNYVLQNLIDSHDTPRVASMLINPGREYDKQGTPEEGFDVRKPTEEERKVQKLIALLQYTYIGAPMIFYGTEAGMWGADDPDDRKPMVWPDMEFAPETAHPLGKERPADENNFDHDLFNWYKRLGAIRNEHRVFQCGKFELLKADSGKDVFAFARFINNDHFGLVILNRSEQPQSVTVPVLHFEPANGMLTDILSEATYGIVNNELQITVQPVSGMVLMPS